MHAFSLKLLLAAALGWVAPVSGQQPDRQSERCLESRAALVTGSAERVVEPAFFEPRHQGLLP